jgi:hypothetical protein
MIQDMALGATRRDDTMCAAKTVIDDSVIARALTDRTAWATESIGGEAAFAKRWVCSYFRSGWSHRALCAWQSDGLSVLGVTGSVGMGQPGCSMDGGCSPTAV